MDREKLDQLREGFGKCLDFAQVCQERVMLLEAYKTEADVALKLVTEQSYEYQQEAIREKRKNKLVIPTITLVLGFVIGALIIR